MGNDVFLCLVGVAAVLIGLVFIRDADRAVEETARQTPKWGTPPKPSDRWVFVAVGALSVTAGVALFGYGVLRLFT